MRAKRFVDATLGSRLPGECRCGHDTVWTIGESGLSTQSKLFRFFLAFLSETTLWSVCESEKATDRAECPGDNITQFSQGQRTKRYGPGQG